MYIDLFWIVCYPIFIGEIMAKQDIKEIVKEKFGFIDKDLEGKEDSFSRMSYLDQNKVEEKIKFYMEEFNLTKEEFGKMVKIFPKLLIKSNSNVQSKETFYMKEFKLTKEEFSKMVKVLPSLLGHNEDSVRAKISFYMEEFGLTKKEFCKMLIKMPTLLGLDKDSIINKHKSIKELKIDNSVVVEHPDILTAPEKSLKVRYMILYIVYGCDSFLKNFGWQMTSHKKTWARLCGIREIGESKITAIDLLLSEKNFFQKYKIDSKTLMERYPFTKETVKQINAQYRQVAEKTDGLDLKLSEEELGLDK